jgi:hypothetical protein
MRASNQALLLLLADLHPVFDDFDPAVHDVLLKLGAEFQELSLLFFGAKTHHVFYSRAVVPTSVKDDNFSGRRKMLTVTLHVYLSLFAIRRTRSASKRKTRGSHVP